GNDDRRALRLERRHGPRLRERERGEPLELASGAAAREAVAVDAVPVVAGEPEVERRERGESARDADRRRDSPTYLLRDALGEEGAHRRGAGGELAGLRRVGVEEPLGLADGAELEAVVEVLDDQLRRTAAD